MRPLGKPVLVEIRHILAPFGCFMGPRKMGFGGILDRLQAISFHSRIIYEELKKKSHFGLLWDLPDTPWCEVAHPFLVRSRPPFGAK